MLHQQIYMDGGGSVNDDETDQADGAVPHAQKRSHGSCEEDELDAEEMLHLSKVAKVSQRQG